VFRIALAALLALAVQTSDRPITVSAAISLSGALGEVAKAYKAEGGGDVRYNFAASNVLARQIINGAPVDIFISADEAQMDYAQKTGAIDPATRVRLLSNRLVVVTQADRRADWRDVQALLGGDVKRIAIGDPSGVPAGVYAKQYLEKMGRWSDLQPKLLPLANVRAALGAVESGGAEAGFVYESDTMATSRVRIAFVIEGPNAPQIIYPAAMTTRMRNRPAAARFLEFLRSPAAATIFTRHRFSGVKT
jgi:molybdate transport system substrate-binding protein